jgi:hypothetical protein
MSEAWIQVPNPSRAGIYGGLPLSGFSKEGVWTQDNEGFVVSVLHQLHCVVSFPMSIPISRNHEDGQNYIIIYIGSIEARHYRESERLVRAISL